MKETTYTVVVSNVGTIYSGKCYATAKADFTECAQLSNDNYGRFAGENVTLFEDADIAMEYHGKQED